MGAARNMGEDKPWMADEAAIGQESLMASNQDGASSASGSEAHHGRWLRTRLRKKGVGRCPLGTVG